MGSEMCIRDSRNSERKWPSPYGTSTDNLTRRNCIASFLQVDETETSDGIEVIVVFVPEYPNDGYLAGGFGIGSPPAWLTSGAHGGPFYEWYEGPSTNVASDNLSYVVADFRYRPKNSGGTFNNPLSHTGSSTPIIVIQRHRYDTPSITVSYTHLTLPTKRIV